MCSVAVERGGFVESSFIVGLRLYRPPTIKVKSNLQLNLSRRTLDALWALSRTARSWFICDHSHCRRAEQCQHRMACAKCDFYMPKQSTAALLLEGKKHLLRLLHETPLGEAYSCKSASGGLLPSLVQHRELTLAFVSHPTRRA
jgi:hypothetical protein